MIRLSTVLRKITGIILVLLPMQLAWAQDSPITISGKITSADDNQPLPGASIVIKGTTTGTVSDAEGKYSIKAQTGSVLVFSFVGMDSQEIPIAIQTTIDIVLVSNATNLGEVVITALGIERNKREIGYAISDLSGDRSKVKSIQN